MNKNALTIGEAYAIRLGRGRWGYTRKGVYLGDSPWLTGTGEASLTTLRRNDPNISGGEDGVLRYQRDGFYPSIRIRNDAAILSHADVEWIVQPNTSDWRSSAFENRGKGTRGLFVMTNEAGTVEFTLVAYGDKIQRTWAEHKDEVIAAQEARERYEADRAVLDQYRLAIVREALEVLDGLGTDQNLILGRNFRTREEVLEDLDADPVSYWLADCKPAALVLLGAGKHDPFDLLLTHKREEA